MVLQASATTVVEASPRQVLELVLDLDRYRQADRKILRVSKVTGPDDAGRGSVRMWGRVKGLPPAPDVQNFQLDRWNRLTFTGAPRQPGRLVFDFVGTFDCVPLDNGATEVTHAYEFTFKGPFRLVERRLGPWLQEELDTEMTQIAAMVAS